MSAIDDNRIAPLRDSLAADGYTLEVRPGSGGTLAVRIHAAPEACADCLVPKDIMRAILANALGVAGQAIELSYPTDLEAPGDAD